MIADNPRKPSPSACRRPRFNFARGSDRFYSERYNYRLGVYQNRFRELRSELPF